MNEADTRATLIDPKLKIADWSDTQVTREYFYQRDYKYTDGRILLVGNQHRRATSRKADYLLRYTEGTAIAVIEAKADTESAEVGLEQAKGYAKDLGLTFAYASNGHSILEYDFFTHSSRELNQFPNPQDLWNRWTQNTAKFRAEDLPIAAELQGSYRLARQENPLLHSYCPESLCGKRPHYFQEVAIREVIKRFMWGQRRALLALATGTGKTFISFQAVWKLIKSGWLKRRHPQRPARILFLADRVILRNQAYNTFSPFVDAASDPRYLIEGHPVNLNRDLYFGIYQTLWSADETGKRLFQKFPNDFFDLVIIDECHRSGFGTWREILDHFGSAIHLGMTATPKQDENIDTYSYFCSDESQELIDPADPSKGYWRPPAYQYSLGQGIEDGFLATYKVHRVRTTVDAAGLRLEDAIEQGAEVFIPPEASVRDVYMTPQFEREITLPDRTQTMVKHLSGLLRRFGPMAKSMVFCVDMDHARLVSRLLQDEFGPETGLDNYSLPIVSEEGDQAQDWLESFADSDKKAPVVATTAELLSTGVDVPSCKNVVFMKTLSSPLLFKQIVGRGCRLDPGTDKYWFRIIDYTGATRLFDEWDLPPVPPAEPPSGPLTASLEGRLFHVETNQLLVGASISVRTGPNTQQGPILTDENGEFRFVGLPGGRLTVMVSANGFVPRDIKVDTVVNETTVQDVPLKPAGKGIAKVKVKGLEVTIADETTFMIENTGQQLSLSEYQDYARKELLRAAPTKEELQRIWIDPSRRRPFIEDLRRASIHPEILAEILNYSEADTYDLLAYLAFGSPIRTRGERATAFKNREQPFLAGQAAAARRVILELLEKYRVGGIDQVDPEVFSVAPFNDMGGAVRISRLFGGVGPLKSALTQIQERIYREQGALDESSNT